ncbi:nucleotidyltransferase domain-containing protein [Halomonas sp. GXIMD04776]|uniref:nucleotidyltransferase domain-containing protein n=1 Tax=Halomonas sp. GXIMD04776 TaxID=3415605 RepID=UPI003CA4A389
MEDIDIFSIRGNDRSVVTKRLEFPLRLTDDQIRTIKQTTSEIFGPGVQVRLFGSRLDNSAKGGDIDLLVESEHLIDEKLAKALTLTARLQLRLGDQPFDVLVVDPGVRLNAVHQQALRTGQSL